MFLELDVLLYSSFDRSGTTGLKYSSLRGSLLTVLRVVYAVISSLFFNLLKTETIGTLFP